MARASDPARIDALVGNCLDSIAGAAGAGAIWRVWEEAVGSHIARRAQPVRFRNSTLIVAVSSAPWMQELTLLKPDIRTALNARLPRPLVGDLFFVPCETGDAATTEAASRPAPRRCALPPAAVDLDVLPESLRRSFDDLLAAWRRRAG
jgi:hypothetical protein